MFISKKQNDDIKSLELSSAALYNVCHFRVDYFPSPVNILNEEFKCMQPYVCSPSSNKSKETSPAKSWFMCQVRQYPKEDTQYNTW